MRVHHPSIPPQGRAIQWEIMRLGGHVTSPIFHEPSPSLCYQAPTPNGLLHRSTHDEALHLNLSANNPEFRDSLSLGTRWQLTTSRLKQGPDPSRSLMEGKMASEARGAALWWPKFPPITMMQWSSNLTVTGSLTHTHIMHAN